MQEDTQVNQEEVAAIAEAHGVDPAATVMVPRPATAAQSRVNVSQSQVIKMITSAIASGQMSQDAARDFRRKLGIPNSVFTKKKVNKAKAKSRKKTAKASRRRNRGQGKGQKRTGGLRVYSRT